MGDKFIMTVNLFAQLVLIFIMPYIHTYDCIFILLCLPKLTGNYSDWLAAMDDMTKPPRF